MKTNRRDFAKAVSAIPFIAATDLLAQAPTESTATPLSKALTEMVRAQSGQFLDEADMERIAKDFQDLVPLLEELRKFKLVNSDEPWR